MAEKTYAQAIKDVLRTELTRDPKLFLMGEDVAALGGPYAITRGLVDEFGAHRIRNAPISEAAHIGVALGAACAGIPAIVELQYWDFGLVAADQIVNQVAKTRFVFGGQAKIPLVIRGQQGIGRGNGATHSQCLETMFMHWPGLKIVCPSSANEAAGLLRTAIRDENPVCVFEHKYLYYSKEEVNEDPDFMIPFGQACVKREGTDCTIVANSLCLRRSLEAAELLEKEGISVEVIDPRTLVPFDYDTVVESVKKTGHLLISHECHTNAGWGAEVATSVMERAFKYLDAPVERVCTMDCPIPFNPFLEAAATPQVADIVAGVKKLLCK